jgi:hypothetical protein
MYDDQTIIMNTHIFTYIQDYLLAKIPIAKLINVWKKNSVIKLQNLATN